MGLSREEFTDKYRTREIDRSDPIRTLLNSLTLESVREAAYNLAPTRKVKIRSHASSYEDLLQVKRSTEDIVQALLDVEAQTPFKHALIARANEPSSILQFGAKLRDTCSAGGFDFLVRHFKRIGDFSYVTLEHTVMVKEWVEGESSDTRKLEQYETRHPVVVRLCMSTGLLLISYPGFTQGTGTKRTSMISYGDLLAAAVKVLSSLGLNTHALPIRESLKVLLAGANRRVHSVRADIEKVDVGRFDLSSLKQDRTVEESLADLILPHLKGVTTREELIDSAKRAINSAESNLLILYWVEESVLTRLKFWDIGCEMLFTWHGERASYRAIDSLLLMLHETQGKIAAVSNQEHESALTWLAAQQASQILRPADLAERLQISAADARKELVYAVKAGLLVPVFRLATNQAVEGSLNDWTDDPGELRRTWMLDDGGEVDGANPANIDVAFRRVAAGGLQ